MALIARVHDTHANLWSSLDARPPTGACQIPVTLRFIENQAVVTGYSHAESGPATGLQVGDVVTRTRRRSRSSDLVERWTPFYAASNQPTRLRDIARSMTRGACGEATVRVTRDRETLELKPTRVAEAELSPTADRTHDRRGDTFQKLSPDVAYLKLSSVQAAQAGSYIDSAAGTKGLIIDIRNYPSEFVVFALGSRLVDRVDRRLRDSPAAIWPIPAPFIGEHRSRFSRPPRRTQERSSSSWTRHRKASPSTPRWRSERRGMRRSWAARPRAPTATCRRSPCRAVCGP